jgi:transcriptional regulator with XRE-family HTH domain
VKSVVAESLPRSVIRQLQQLGADIAVARKKRHLTIAMIAERIGVAHTTYLRVERGDASVAIGTYAMALFVLGFDQTFGSAADPRDDDIGLALDRARLPQRIRVARPRAEP